MYKLIRDPEGLKEIKVDYTRPIFCDTETCAHEGYAEGGLYGQIRLLQIYQAHWDNAYLIDIFFVDLDTALALIQPGHLIWHNASFDMHTINCNTEHLWLPQQLGDTLYLSRLAFPIHRKYGYYDCLKHAGVYHPELDKVSKKSKQVFDWSKPLLHEHLKYAEYDVTYLCDLYQATNFMEDSEIYKLDIQNLTYAIKYDRRGIPVNMQTVRDKLRKASIEAELVLENLPVNPNSSVQCQKILGTTKADVDMLMKLKLEGNEVAGDILKARQLIKERMYLTKYNRPKIFGFHNPCGTISGRFSCTGGQRYGYSNIQQIPRRLLSCLEAPEGHMFVYKDYAGLELRMAVAWTGEPTMERLMRNNTDLHTYTGCSIYKKNPEDLSKHERLVGKILNFTLVYGAWVPATQAALRSWGDQEDFQTVKAFRNNWLNTYEYFKMWHKMHHDHFRVYGYKDIETALGRKVRTFSVNDALNIPIQGSSAEVTKMSLKYLSERYSSENLVNTIHDSNCLVVPEDTVDMWVKRLNECMIDAWYYVIKDLAVPDLPMPAEATYSKTWDF